MVTASQSNRQHPSTKLQGSLWVETYRSLLSREAVRNDPINRRVVPMDAFMIGMPESLEITTDASVAISETQEASSQFIRRPLDDVQQRTKYLISECRKQHIELVYRHVASELPKRGKTSSEPQPLSRVIEDYLVEVLTESPVALSKVLENYYAPNVRRREELADVTQRFRELADRWKADIYYVSSMSKIVDHPAYQEIIEMGAKALPLIFHELAKNPDWWFTALEAIVETPPALDGSEVNLQEATRVWVEWGKSEGYIS